MRALEVHLSACLPRQTQQVENWRVPDLESSYRTIQIVHELGKSIAVFIYELHTM